MNFFQKYKKAFLIIGFLVVVAFLSWALYSLFFKGESFLNLPDNIASSTPGISTGLPSSGEGTGVGTSTTGIGTIPSSSSSTGSNQPAYSEGISEIALGGETKVNVVTQSSAVDPIVAADGTIRYYSQDDGRFYQVNSDGSVSRLSDKVFYEVDDVSWGNSGNKAIIQYPDSSKILYDFSSNTQVTLPSHWEDFSFSSDDSQIVAKSIGLDPENRWLIVSSDDGSNAVAIEAIGENADTVYPSWSPNNQIVAMYTKGIDFNRQEVYFLGLNEENFKSTTVEGRGLETQWSQDGSRLLYSVYNSSNNMKPMLWVVDAEGESISENRQSLGLETWSSKCAFASTNELYCAVPQDLPAGAGILPEVADRTNDDIYKIDINTGAKTLVALPEGNHTVSQIVISEDGSKLYFTDKQNDGLYSIKLK